MSNSKTTRSGKPRIDMRSGSLNKAVLQAESVLVRTDSLKYFQRGIDLVKPVRYDKQFVRELDRAPESVVAQPVSIFTLVRDVNAHAYCYQFNDGKSVKVSFTHDHAHHLLDRVRAGQAKYRALDMITSTPVLLPDHTVLSQPGYQCGVLLVPVEGQTYPAVPEHVTEVMAKQAALTFEEIFHKFPFVNPGLPHWYDTPSYAVVLAAILSLVARPALPSIPMISVDAPVRGSGKTKITEAISLIGVGHKPTVVSFNGPTEFSKLLVPLLREGDRTVLIDNVARPLEGDSLTACSLARDIRVASLVRVST